MNRTRHILRDLRRDLVKNRWIYIMAIPVIAFYILFSYIPMAGVQIAFKDYNFGAGIWGSPWAGLKHFIAFFSGPYAWRTIRNTMLLSLYTILVTFPLPIVFALLLNEVKSKLFKRTIQTVSYLPHFISLVVICGIIKEFTQSTGLVSSLLAMVGVPAETMLQDPARFRSIYVVSQPRIKNDGLCFDISDKIVVDVNIAFLVIVHGIAFADLNFLNQAHQRGTV